MNEFKARFRYDDESKGFIVSSFFIAAAIGGLFSSYLGDHLSRRLSISLGCGIFSVGGLVQALSNTLPVLFAGRAVSGFAVGITASLVPLYNSELAPKDIRGRLISFNQIAMTGGVSGQCARHERGEMFSP